MTWSAKKMSFTTINSRSSIMKGSLGSLFLFRRIAVALGSWILVLVVSAYGCFAQSTTWSSQTSQDVFVVNRAYLSNFFANRSVLDASVGAVVSTNAAFNQLGSGFLAANAIRVDVGQEWRSGAGWYYGPRLKMTFTDRSRPAFDLDFLAGHRGQVGRLELYLQGMLTRELATSSQFNATAFTGMVGLVWPIHIGAVSSLRAGLSVAPFRRFYDDKEFVVANRTLSGLDWNLNLSFVASPRFMLTGALGLRADYYVVTINPRSELDRHQFNTTLTARFFVDRHGIADKILKFY